MKWEIGRDCGGTKDDDRSALEEDAMADGRGDWRGGGGREGGGGGDGRCNRIAWGLAAPVGGENIFFCKGSGEMSCESLMNEFQWYGLQLSMHTYDFASVRLVTIKFSRNVQ